MTKNKLINFLKTNFAFIFFLIFSVVVRLISINDALFFTWDNGRDYFAVKQIVEGNLTLIGPTTGLPGFFLGPLWFYLGVPGFVISNGNPFWFAMGYIILGLISLPMFWIIAHKLFKNKRLAVLTAYLISIVPGSLWGTIRVWNPLIAIPLFSAIFLSLLKARKSRLFLALAFFLLGLALQAEFAYAIFYSFTLFFLIPWIRQEINIRDFLAAGFSIGVTLLAQIAFELRHGFVMSKALYGAIFGDLIEKISWIKLFSQRPEQLFRSTKDLLIRGGHESMLPFLILLALIFIGAYTALKKKDLIQEKTSAFAWKLIGIMAILPYPFYMLWKGNYGNFFDYYITSHFIFLVPLLVLGAVKIYNLKQIGSFDVSKNIKIFIIGLFGLFATYIYQDSYVTTLKPINNAGLKTMNTAIEKIYEWIELDEEDPGIIRIFTPNAETEHYDSIVHFQAQESGRDIPITVKNDSDNHWYILIEPDYHTNIRLDKWYKEATEGGTLIRKEKVGDLKIESWERKEK